MKRAIAVTAAVAALGAVLLSGCRGGDAKAGGTKDGSTPVTTSDSAGPGAPGAPGAAPGGGRAPGGGQPGAAGGADADADLDAVDGILDQFDNQTSQATQNPSDAD